MTQPRLSTEISAAGDVARGSLDWDPMVLQMRGFTPAGVFRCPATYIMDTDGTDYYVHNAYQTIYGGPDDVGGIDGGDAALVLQTALDDLSTVGGRVYMKQGIYPMLRPIDLQKRVALIGETSHGYYYPGDWGTILRAADDMSGDKDAILTMGTTWNGAPAESNIEISNLQVDGSTYDVTSGIYLKLTEGVDIKNVIVKDFSDHGIFLQAPEHTHLDTVHSISHGVSGLYCVGAVGTYVKNSQFTNSAIGIKVEEETHVLHFFQNDIYLNSTHGIQFIDGEYSIDDVVISENNLHDNTLYGIAQCDALIKPRITNNRFKLNGWGALNDNPGAQIRDNEGYYNECYFTAEAANGDLVDFPSEFVEIPNVITASVYEDDGQVYNVQPILASKTQVKIKLRDLTDGADEAVAKTIMIHAKYEAQ